MFQKYIHLERFGTDEVDGVNVGECHIFPKLDDTNASVWVDGPHIKCGSRNRELSREEDNAGFMHYDQYSELAKQYGVEFIPCTLKSRNPTYEILLRATEDNRFLIKEGQGHGEGIVIKQYGWKNRFGRTTFAKLITNTFKDKHIQEMGGSVVNAKLVEEEIADEFLTDHMVEKIISKIRSDKGSFGARDIPQLLGMAYHDLVTEELWQAIKVHKNPRIDFKTLNHCTIARVKKLQPQLFGLPVSA